MFKNLLLISVLFTQVTFAKQNTVDVQQRKYGIIGNILKNVLESTHYVKKPLNDAVSEMALKEYLKKIDFRKQFLFEADVKEFSKNKYLLDDQLLSGNTQLVVASSKVINERAIKAEKLRKKYFKKKFKFNTKETLEFDPDKRTYFSNEKQFEEDWRKTFKQATLTRYLSIKEIEENEGKDKDKKSKKSKKPKKKLTEKEMWDKAHVAISDKYKSYFQRLQEETIDDYFEKFVNAITLTYGPHTNYLAPKTKEDFDIDISGQLEGIGAVLQEDEGYIKVVSIVTGGAAWRQRDLEVDDIILSVSQEDSSTADLVNMRVGDAVRYIRGPKGTVVSLTVKKADGSVKVIPITRDIVEVGASFAKSSILKHKKLNSKIGYIHLPKFYRNFENGSRNCTDDVRNEVLRLKKQKVDAIVLDLRGNGGGALTDAKLMSGLFIEKGPIVQVMDSSGKKDILRDVDPKIEYDGPLIVMTNRLSASASEILAGAMQDYGRAIIVGGADTHGKGTVQGVFDFNQGALMSMIGGKELGAVKITTQKFYRVTGLSTQYKGIVPDIILPDPYGYAESREKDLENSLPFDTVAPNKFKPWTKFSYNIKLLKQRSEDRIKKNKKFSLINESVNYLTKRKDMTNVSLNLAEVVAENKKNEKMTKKFKIEKQNMEIEVSHFEDSLKSHKKIRKQDEDKWNEDFKIKKEEWLKGLRIDPGIEEVLFIADDAINSLKGTPLASISKDK